MIRPRPLRLFMLMGLLLSLATVLPMSGCFSYHRAKGEAMKPTQLPPDAWPEFETSGLEPLLETPPTIMRYEIEDDTLRRYRPNITDEQIAEARALLSDDLIRCELAHGGLFRLWTPRMKTSGKSAKDDLFSFGGRVERFVRNGSYLSASTAQRELAKRRIEGDDDSLAKLALYMSGVSGVKKTDVEERWQLRDGLSVGLPQDIPQQPIGLILHINSLIENRYEHDVLRRMEAHAWAVAHLDSDIYVDGPNALAAKQRREEQRKRERELYEQHPDNPSEAAKQEHRVYTNEEIRTMGEIHSALWKQVRAELPSIETGFEIHPDDDLRAKAGLIASAIDTRLAEHAYAAESLVESIDELHPELAGKPIVVMGFSAGAMPAPTVAARLHEAYPDRRILLVMVGGGGDLLTISRGSKVASGGIYLDPIDGPKPTAEQLDQLQAEYEQLARLDPLAVAPAIRDIPTLHIYADRDSAVPTVAAQRFNTAHGHVDRLVHHGDHDTLFYFIPGQAGKIRSWLRSQGIE